MTGGLVVTRREIQEVRFPAEEFEAKEGVAPYTAGGGVTKAYGLTALGIIGSVPPPGCGRGVRAARREASLHLPVSFMDLRRRGDTGRLAESRALWRC